MKNLLIGIQLILYLCFGSKAFLQNVAINVNNCPTSTACNPFLNGSYCGTSFLLRTSHGSPSLNVIPPPSPNKGQQIKMESRIDTRGAQRTEGLLIQYAFKPNVNYTVKITHFGDPAASGTLYPKLIAALTNFPVYSNDGCDQGQLVSTNVYASYTLTVSPAPAVTSVINLTPTIPVGFLWIMSSPVGVSLSSLLISKIEIIDGSVPPPPDECHTGDFDWFCDNGPNPPQWIGDYNFRYTNSITLNCILFRDYANTQYVKRNFVSKAIYLNPGAYAGGNRGVFKLIAASDPCTAPLNKAYSSDSLAFVKTKNPEYRIGRKTDDRLETTTLNNQSFKIFPNPAAKNLIISYPVSTKLIRIFDLNGRVVKIINTIGTNGLINLDVGSLSEGIYTATIVTDKETGYQKFAISR